MPPFRAGSLQGRPSSSRKGGRPTHRTPEQFAKGRFIVTTSFVARVSRRGQKGRSTSFARIVRSVWSVCFAPLKASVLACTSRLMP